MRATEEAGLPARDRTPEEGPRRTAPFPIYGVLDNLRSAWNVGAIFRTAEASRIAGLHLCGITPYPPHRELDRTALGTSFHVPWRHHIETRSALAELRSEGVEIWAFEVAAQSTPLPDVKIRGPVALVFGHETAGIGVDTLALVDALVEIPLYGRKNSLNVATAFGIAVYELTRQWRAREGSSNGG